MAHIKLDTVLMDPDNLPIDDGKATLRVTLKNALLSDGNPDDPPHPITGEEKCKRFELFLKLRSATDETDWTAEEIATLKKLSLLFGTYIAGTVRSLLEGN